MGLIAPVALILAAGLGLVLVAALAYALVVPGALALRRNRRRARATTPAGRVGVAWAETTESLTAAGLRPRRDETHAEVAEAARPLVDAGLVPAGLPISASSITGYSGGGKKMIADYDAARDARTLDAARMYALGLVHKHLPEMRAYTGLAHAPVFVPIVDNYYRGLAVSIPLEPRLLPKRMTASDVREFLAEHYSGQRFVRVMPFDLDANLEEGFFNVEACNLTNRADVFVFGNDERILLMVRLDNLGKGASGAAVQCMNIMLGLDEGAGLDG